MCCEKKKSIEKRDGLAKFILLYGLMVSFLLFSFIFDSINNIAEGFVQILRSPSLLSTDYIEIGGLGATLVSVASVMFLLVSFIHICKAKVDGPILGAAIFVMGYSFFGNNMLNVFPFLLGSYLYAHVNRIEKTSIIVPAFYATSLGPIISYLLFASDLPLTTRIVFSFSLGLIQGYFVPLLSKQFLRLHEGYTLYNVGFTCGVIAFLTLALLRFLGLDPQIASHVSKENQEHFMLFLAIIFAIMILSGYLLNKTHRSSYFALMQTSGILGTDFDSMFGSGLCFINMGIIGLMNLVFVYLTSAPRNGLVIGSVLAVVGFASAGKHPRNTVPIMLGVYIITRIHPEYFNPSTAASTSLFATALAPIAGDFGFFAGIFVGALHAIFAKHALQSHAGLNLYNNGFTSGFVAAFSLPITRYFHSLLEKPSKVQANK